MKTSHRQIFAFKIYTNFRQCSHIIIIIIVLVCRKESYLKAEKRKEGINIDLYSKASEWLERIYDMKRLKIVTMYKYIM